jgi:hypothetical protein
MYNRERKWIGTAAAPQRANRVRRQQTTEDSRPGESIPQLLRRLNDSIALAVEADEMIDEINVRAPPRNR